MLFCPYEPFWGVKNKKILNVIFLWGILWPRWPYFDTHEWQMDAKFKISAPNYPWGHKNPKNELWRHQRSLTSDDLGWPRNGHNVSVNHGCHLATPIHVHITSKIPKFASFRRWNGTERTFRLTCPWRLGHRSKVMAGTILTFSEKM